MKQWKIYRHIMGDHTMQIHYIRFNNSVGVINWDTGSQGDLIWEWSIRKDTHTKIRDVLDQRNILEGSYEFSDNMNLNNVKKMVKRKMDQIRVR